MDLMESRVEFGAGWEISTDKCSHFDPVEV